MHNLELMSLHRVLLFGPKFLFMRGFRKKLPRDNFICRGGEVSRLMFGN